MGIILGSIAIKRMALLETERGVLAWPGLAGCRCNALGVRWCVLGNHSLKREGVLCRKKVSSTKRRVFPKREDVL